MRLAIAQIGEPLELVEILRVFSGRIEQLKDGKLWIRKFIEFQYGILSPECKPHQAVIKRLECLGIKTTQSKGYPKGIHTLQEKEKDKEKEKEGESEGDGFDNFWYLYPNKQNKVRAHASWARIKTSEHPAIMDGLRRWVSSEDWKKDNGQFIPHPASWLNAHRWEDHPRSFKSDDRFEAEQREWEEKKKRGEIKYASRP